MRAMRGRITTPLPAARCREPRGDQDKAAGGRSKNLESHPNRNRWSAADVSHARADNRNSTSSFLPHLGVAHGGLALGSRWVGEYQP